MTIRSYCLELYSSRNILKALVVQNLFGRYKNTIIGFGWHFIMPIVTMFVYYVVFTQVHFNPIPDFWVYLASALFPFYFMVNNLIGGSSCLIRSSGMIKKMYFPREILIFAQVISSFIVTIIGFAVIMVALILTGYNIGIASLFIPFLFIIMFIFVIGIVLIVSSITVYIKDIQYVLASLSPMFFFITPMYFSTLGIDGLLYYVVWLNPFSYYVECFHDVIYYGDFPDTSIIIITLGLGLTTLIFGLLIFNKLKVGFAERL